MYVIQHCFICRPLDSTLSEDAGIEPRTVAISALTVSILLTIEMTPTSTLLANIDLRYREKKNLEKDKGWLR
jgi:hypothetical protein